MTNIARHKWNVEDMLLGANRDLFTPPLGGVYTPCDMSTYPLGRTPRGHKVVSTRA